MDSESIVRQRFEEFFMKAGDVRRLRVHQNRSALEALYTDPSRGYHGIAHIEACLNEFDVFRYLARDQNAVEIAIYYHDAWMSFKEDVHDNEEKSAMIMRDHVSRLGVPSYDIDAIAYLIVDGTKHRGDLTDNDAQLMADIDLASFGHPFSVMVANSRKIRHEYRAVSRDRYIKKRREILKRFLGRGIGLYYHTDIRDTYGAKAIQNISREIEILPDLVAQFDRERREHA